MVRRWEGTRETFVIGPPPPQEPLSRSGPGDEAPGDGVDLRRGLPVRCRRRPRPRCGLAGRLAGWPATGISSW
ncbi:hypothetical protein [Streptomyces sp. NPDC058678]|uniref:hypothetical protein n=1 Tax=Streptomyces sp. NPDC058678 TaxID=3346595 RepID=UPI0036473A15